MNFNSIDHAFAVEAKDNGDGLGRPPQRPPKEGKGTGRDKGDSL